MSLTEAPPAAPGCSTVLEPILANLNAGPSRTWSLIITMFGDAFVPRERAVWLGTLLDAFRGFDIGDGVVRTAMSRLTADGWLERSKVGRNSYYRLGQAGRAEFERATDKIYTRRPPPWNGHFVLLMPRPKASDDWTQRAGKAGMGSPSPGVWIGPDEADLAGDAIRLQITGDPADLGALAARAWDLDAIAEAYTRFVDVFEPLGVALKSGISLSDRDAFLARTLLIHAWRRIILRDPLLPPEVLPMDWPGTSARQVCGSIYRRLLTPSEAWLDANAIGEDGAAVSGRVDLVGARFRD
jgi:phenylacetic acid degradation operon negative regulatory protein